MAVSKQHVRHIAELARLELSPEELEMYTEQLSVIFEYMNVLAEVDVDGVEETCQVTGLEDIFRDDVVEERSKERIQGLIDEFPSKIGRLLQVSAVFSKDTDSE